MRCLPSAAAMAYNNNDAPPQQVAVDGQRWVQDEHHHSEQEVLCLHRHARRGRHMGGSDPTGELFRVFFQCDLNSPKYFWTHVSLPIGDN